MLHGLVIAYDSRLIASQNHDYDKYDRLVT